MQEFRGAGVVTGELCHDPSTAGRENSGPPVGITVFWRDCGKGAGSVGMIVLAGREKTRGEKAYAEIAEDIYDTGGDVKFFF